MTHDVFVSIKVIFIHSVLINEFAGGYPGGKVNTINASVIITVLFTSKLSYSFSVCVHVYHQGDASH